MNQYFLKYLYLALKRYYLKIEVVVLPVYFQLLTLQSTPSKILPTLEFWRLLRILWCVVLFSLHIWLKLWLFFKYSSHIISFKVSFSHMFSPWWIDTCTSSYATLDKDCETPESDTSVIIIDSGFAIHKKNVLWNPCK